MICRSIYIFWKFIQYTKTEIKLKFSSDNKIFKKMHSLFFHKLQLIFNSWFLYELKNKVHLSKTVCGILHVRFYFIFIKAYIFIQQKAWVIWLWNVLISFKITIIEKSHMVLIPYFWLLSFKIRWYLCVLELPIKLPGDELFKLGKTKFWKLFSVILNSNFEVNIWYYFFDIPTYFFN